MSEQNTLGALLGGSPVRKTRQKKRTTVRRASSRAKAPKAKRPCKYGPRDDEGYCPKKPKVDLVTRQIAKAAGVKVSRASKDPVRRTLEAAAGRTVSKGLEGGVKGFFDYFRDHPEAKAAFLAGLSGVAKKALGIAVPLAAIAGSWKLLQVAADAQGRTDKENASIQAYNAVEAINKKLPVKLTSDQFHSLIMQYEKFFLDKIVETRRNIYRK